MVVGGNEGLMDLHVEKSFDNLRKRAQVCEAKMTLTSKERYLEIMDNMNIKINEAFLKKDQEQEYILLFRFVQVVTKMAAIPNSNGLGGKKRNMKMYQNMANKHMDRLEELEPLLKQRYIEKESRKSLNLTKSNDIYSFGVSETVVEPPQDTFVKGEIGNWFVEVGELFNLLNSKTKVKKQSCLLIDCRMSYDYEESRINYDDQIHIPQLSIIRGTSASVLQYSIKKEFLDKWEKRHSYDTIILMDKDSTCKDIVNNPQLHVAILKEIMIKWDMKGYKCLALLEGGFEEFENRYPQFTTNPVRYRHSKYNNDKDILKNFKYPDLIDPVVKKPAEPPVVKPSIPSINRSTKPKASFPALKEFSDQEKSKASIEQPSKEGGEPTVNSSDTDGQPMETDGVEDDQSTPACEESTLPDPSISTLQISHKDNKGGDTSLEGGKETQDEDMDQGDSMLNSQQKIAYINNLRKIKPKPSESRLPSSVGSNERMDYSSSSSDDEGMSTVPLKSDGVGSGMKRSLSSPNITKIKDDDMVPMFSRSNKPSYSSPRAAQSPSLVLGENPESIYGKTQLGLTGLKNFANNCYMNSIIQCLSNTAPLVQELTNFSSKKLAVNTSSMTKGQIAKVFISALHYIWSGDLRMYSIRDLKDLMGNYKEIFKGSNHQDSHEFLIILLEYLHDDLNLPREVTVLTGANEQSGERAWGEFRKKNESIIQRLFYGQEQSSVTCTVCQHRSVTFDHFFNLSVPIPDADRTTLEECIQVYLSGENIMWTCPKCKVDRKAVKKLDITRLPPILIIALKRFSHEVSWLEKKETLVTYPLENLELRHLTLPGSEHRHTSYNLHALSTHTGTLRAGHYRAICQNHLTNKWYLFDDTYIHSISTQEVRNNPEVYILFYHAVK